LLLSAKLNTTQVVEKSKEENQNCVDLAHRVYWKPKRGVVEITAAKTKNKVRHRSA